MYPLGPRTENRLYVDYPLPQGCPGHLQVHSTGLLEREDRVGPIAEHLRPARGQPSRRTGPRIVG
jgi:hypothetical protein